MVFIKFQLKEAVLHFSLLFFRWVVDDDQFPTKPTYLCKQCLDVFYTRNGQRTDPPYCCMLPGTTDNSHDDS